MRDWDKIITEQEQKVKELISTKVLTQITDKSVETIIRRIIFDSENTINWDKAEYNVLSWMPELKEK
jgi:hypothetical protein